MSERRLKLLTFTTLYPSAVRPRHGIFVETRLMQLRRYAGADLRVVAPVPWFPSPAMRFGNYALFARTPRREDRAGVLVYHPRYLMIPGVGMYTQPMALAAGTASTLRAIQRSGYDFDLIDAHYFYPDGVAAALLARHFGKPLVITARGSDVNLLPNYALPRRLIVWAARQADAVVTVSAALKERLSELGVDRSRIQVLRNGVDLELFRPMDKAAARKALNLGGGPLFASVGNLVPEKGHDLVIEAVAALSGATLLIVGDGPERVRLEEHARRHNVASRVHFLAVRPQAELCAVYAAADALVLASSREGWPNVLLESMACGTAVIATDVGGVREVVGTGSAGKVVSERSSAALAQAMRELLSEAPSAQDVRRYAKRFAWHETSKGQLTLFEDVIRERGRHVSPVW